MENWRERGRSKGRSRSDGGGRGGQGYGGRGGGHESSGSHGQSKTTTQATTAAREVATSTLDTPAGGRKAMAAAIAGGRTAAVMTVGGIPHTSPACLVDCNFDLLNAMPSVCLFYIRKNNQLLYCKKKMSVKNRYRSLAVNK
jgi:hypothetical protein